MTSTGRTVHTLNISPKVRSVAADADDKVAYLHWITSQPKKTKTINYLKIQSTNIMEEGKWQISYENIYVVEFQVQLNEEKVESSVPHSSGNRVGKIDRSNVLIEWKVKNDFGGELFGGVVISYKVFYKVSVGYDSMYLFDMVVKFLCLLVW